MTATYAKALAEKLRALVTLDPSLDFFGKYMRIKVEINISRAAARTSAAFAVVLHAVEKLMPRLECARPLHVRTWLWDGDGNCWGSSLQLDKVAEPEC